MKKKTISVLLALVLVIGCTVGGTIAWLTASTDAVTNTFTVGDINITLDETTGAEYKMVPGNILDKDPTVTVLADSEACWLFVKIEESANLKDFITYAVADGWTQLEAGVYYREVPAGTADQTFNVLQNNQVKVNEEVTKEMMDGLTDETRPTLTFTAYACQKDNISTAAEAWAKVSQ